MMKFAMEDPEAYLEWFESVSGYVEHLTGVLEMTQTAGNRLALVAEYVGKRGAS